MTTADQCAAERSYREVYGRRFSQGASTGTKHVNLAPPAYAPAGAFASPSASAAAAAYTTPGINTVENIDAQGAASVPTVSRRDATKMKMSQTTLVNTLQMIREPIVDYQENRGVSREEQISFVTLITSLCTQAYTAAITILVMLWNLAPLLDGFVYFARFVLDKLIDILETEDQKEKIIKAAVFFGEIIVVLLIIFLIMGLIFMPVYVLAARIIGKIWGMIAW